MTPLPYGQVPTELADREPERVALVCDGESLSIGELESRANRLARAYAELGVKPGDFVTISLPNSVELCVACLASWKLGAVPNPISSHLPERERVAILERAEPSLVVGVEAAERAWVPADFQPDASLSDAPLPPCTPPHERALASGGSTGEPKLIVAMNPAEYDPATASAIFKPRECVIVPGPIHHAVPFSATFQGIFAGARVVVMPRFDASACIELIEKHRVDRACFVPTMMLRIWRLPEAERKGFDLSSLEFVMTGGAPCPAWLMQAWIDWLGPEVMHEAFGPSERIGGTFITGTEWLAHPGSVGKPIGGGRIKIVDDAGNELPPGEMGEIWMMPPSGPGTTYRYVGARSRADSEGFESVGDMGYLDGDGYLFLGDRRTDMILSGGRNIYPAEVEAAIEAHPTVRSSAVVGLPDEDMGQRIHAIVEVDANAAGIDGDALREHLTRHLVQYKIPRSFEFSDRPLRDDAGKVRRSALREERIARLRER